MSLFITVVVESTGIVTLLAVVEDWGVDLNNGGGPTIR